MEKYRLSDKALVLWLNYIEHQIGFVLPKSQNLWVKGIIERHMQHTQLDSTALLQAVVQDETLYHQLIDDILIPRTQFFRHIPTFEFAEQFAKTWQMQPNNAEAEFIAWSVGCSTGQEAATIALCVDHALTGSKQFRVYGSDFHQRALAEANIGQYHSAQKQFIPTQYHKRLDDIDSDKFVLNPRLREHLQFFSKNLVDYQQDIPLHEGQCQLIICKNVLIYFRQFEQRDIVRFLSRYLADDGILLLGAGQNIGFNEPSLMKMQIATLNGYCKRTAPDWLKKLAHIDQ